MITCPITTPLFLATVFVIVVLVYLDIPYASLVEYTGDMLKVYNMGKRPLNELEKKLELKMENYKKRLSAVDQELQSVKGMLDKNMQSAFSYK